MKRLMYCPIYRDDLEDIFEKGLTPSSRGFIELYDNYDDAEFYCNTDHPNYMCILKVLVNESSLTAYTTLFCTRVFTVYQFEGMLSHDSIALHEHDIEYV